MRSVQQYLQNIKKHSHDAPFRRNLMGSPGGYDTYLQNVRLRNEKKKANLYQGKVHEKEVENLAVKQEMVSREQDYLNRINEKEISLNKLLEEHNFTKEEKEAAKEKARILRQKKKDLKNKYNLSREEMEGLNYRLGEANTEKERLENELVKREMDAQSVQSGLQSQLDKKKLKKKTYKDLVAHQENLLAEKANLIAQLGKEKADEIQREREEKKQILESKNLTNADLVKIRNEYLDLQGNYEKSKKNLEAQEVAGRQQNETMNEYKARMEDYEKRVQHYINERQEFEKRLNLSEEEKKALSKQLHGKEKELADNLSEFSNLKKQNDEAQSESASSQGELKSSYIGGSHRDMMGSHGSRKQDKANKSSVVGDDHVDEAPYTFESETPVEMWQNKWHKAVYGGYNKDFERAEKSSERHKLEKTDLENVKAKLVADVNNEARLRKAAEEKWHKAVYEGYNKDFERAEKSSERHKLEKTDLENVKAKLVADVNNEARLRKAAEEKWHKAVYEGYNKDFERAEDLNKKYKESSAGWNKDWKRAEDLQKRINQSNANIDLYNKYANDVLSPERRRKVSIADEEVKSIKDHMYKHGYNPEGPINKYYGEKFFMDKDTGKMYVGQEQHRELLKIKSKPHLRQKTPRISKI